MDLQKATSGVAAKEKSSSPWLAWLAPILFLAAIAAAQPAPALTARPIETRAWEKSSFPIESRLTESLQLLNLHQQNGGAGYDDALGSPLAAENAGADIGSASSSANKAAIQDALEKGDINATTPQRAGVARPPQHHVFPQNAADKAWFAERGIDVDKFTVTLDQGTHEALHYGGGPGKGGGWWNETIMSQLKRTEADLGRKLTPQEITQIGKGMMNRAKLGNLPFEEYGK